MRELVVGIVLTAVVSAVLGGLLVPALQGVLARRRARFTASVDLLESLAASLWTYWKLAMRVSYYGRKSADGTAGYATALERWDSDESWANGCEIQVQVSRSKRLLPAATHTDLDRTQRAVVDDLDTWVECLRNERNPVQWDTFYKALMGAKRRQIEDLLARLAAHLALAQRSWLVRWWCRLWRRAPADIALEPGFVVGPAGRGRVGGEPGAGDAAPNRPRD